MAEIKKVTLPSGNTYDIVDAGARELISQMSSSTSMLGVSQTALADNSTTNPITLSSGASVRAFNGDMAIYGQAEFVWVATTFSIWQMVREPHDSGDKFHYTKITSPTEAQVNQSVYVRKTEAEMTATQTTPLDYQLGGNADYIKIETAGKWSLFGDLSSLGQLAYKDSISQGAIGRDNVLGADTEFNLTLPSIRHTADLIARVPNASGGGAFSKGTVPSGVSATTKKYKKVSFGTVQVGVTASASEVSVPTGQNAYKLVKQNLSFDVSNGVLSISANGNNTIPFATGEVSTSGTGSDINTGIEVTAVTGLGKAATVASAIGTSEAAEGAAAADYVELAVGAQASGTVDVVAFSGDSTASVGTHTLTEVELYGGSVAAKTSGTGSDVVSAVVSVGDPTAV